MKHIFAVVIAAFFLSGCATDLPKSFIRGTEPGWTSVEIREDVQYEQAWLQAVDVLAKKFELEVISKEGGYIRTSWIHTWWKMNEATSNYRVRAIVKFSPDKKNIDIKTEANYLLDDEWIVGFDDRLLQTVKTDLMGVLGRTTR